MEKEKKRNKKITFTGNSQTINGPSTITLEDIKRNQKKDETPAGTGGVIGVTITYDGISEGGVPTNLKSDKTHAEIMEVINNGGIAYVRMNISGNTEIVGQLINLVDGEQNAMSGIGLTFRGVYMENVMLITLWETGEIIFTQVQ